MLIDAWYRSRNLFFFVHALQAVSELCLTLLRRMVPVSVQNLKSCVEPMAEARQNYKDATMTCPSILSFVFDVCQTHRFRTLLQRLIITGAAYKSVLQDAIYRHLDSLLT
jgi:hypothetical protein